MTDLAYSSGCREGLLHECEDRLRGLFFRSRTLSERVEELERSERIEHSAPLWMVRCSG